MIMLGLHVLDWLVLLLFFAVMILIGLRARRRIRTTSDFYQGGRSFGKWLTAFLNFGNMTDAGQAAGVTREIYRQGLQGVWFQNLVLFHTPFQWFIAALQRRARYLGPADLFLHRFESRFLAGLYAVVLVCGAAYGNATGYLLTGKTLQAMMVKPAAEYTPEEQAAIDGFTRLKTLKSRDYATLPTAEQSELKSLQELEKQGKLKAFISYLDLTTFYFIYAGLIALYTILGGLFAVAILDVVQGLLIIFLSLVLIPIALSAIGGIAGMQQTVPAAMFQLFGSSAASDYTWYFVASFALLNLVVNAPKNFTMGGSAKDDRSARIGFVTGSIFKRFMMIGWAFTGLLAVGLYAGQVADPTNIWGVMTRDLLGVGAIGLMIAAIFAANMDGAATASLDASAALVKNIYLPIRPATTEQRQMLIGRATVLAILLSSIFFALRADDIVAVFKYALQIGAIVGPTFWLVYFWRRLNTRAVAAQIILSITLTIIIPNALPELTGMRTDPALTQRTTERIVEVESRATAEDVRSGKAETLGQKIIKTERVPPVGIYFERVVETPQGLRGEGLFRTNIYLISSVGGDVAGWSSAEISTANLLIDATLPFLLLILFSMLTKPNAEPVLRDFYARIHTPAVADPAEDARLVQEKISNPELVERNKLFPGTNLMFWKPTRFDILGFLACIGFVLLIVGLYMAVASIGME
ncbi:MAG: sodium:solute symporter family protein [Chlorobi bacterium CHB2]|nr:sodium:solute symporter family protein [Chlorobi bacterium CHB2]